MKWLTISIILVATAFPVGHSPFTLVARRPEALEPLPFGAIIAGFMNR